MKQERVIPTFQSETEEADWWFDNRERLDSDLESAESGAKRLDRATLEAILARSEARVVSIRLSEADIELARAQAARKGLPYQTYLKSLLQQALQEAKWANTGKIN